MNLYLAAQVAVYRHLLTRQAQDPTFFFSLRASFSDPPTANEGLFKGTAHSGYFAFTLWHVPLGFPGVALDLLSYLVEVSRNGRLGLKVQLLVPRHVPEGDRRYHPNTRLSVGLYEEILRVSWPAAISWREAAPHSRMLRATYQAASSLPDLDALLAALDRTLAATVPGLDAAVTAYAARQPAWVGYRYPASEFAARRERAEHHCAALLDGVFPPADTRRCWCAQTEADPAAWEQWQQAETVRPLLHDSWDYNGRSGDGRRQLKQLRAGDVVVATYGPRRVLGLGIARGRFTQDDGQPPHYCPVEWLVTVPVELTGTPFTTGLGWNKTAKWPQIQAAYAQLDPPPPGLAQMLPDWPAAVDGLALPDQPAPVESADAPGYWAIGAGEGGTFWEAWQTQGTMSIGWEKLGDLRQYADKEALRQALLRHYGRDTSHNNDMLACWQFCHTVRLGDYVVVKIGRRKILGVGRVAGDYHHDPTQLLHRNTRPVEWLLAGSWEDKSGPGVPTKTLTNITAYRSFLQPILTELAAPQHLQPVDFAFARAQAERIAALKVRLSRAAAAGEGPPQRPPYTLAQAGHDLFLPDDQLQDLLLALRRKKNLIVQGPPGVGKTYVARRLAWLQMGSQEDGRVQLVQFHQSYGYEDFIRGWRPTATGGFELADGVFVTFVRRAQLDPDHDYFFLIDEINRGNLSKIFGELLLLLEADKRSPAYALPLTYRQPGEADFHLPPNLYVIGTMNTADRSLALVDYALRRRFTFVELAPALGDKLRRHLLGQDIPAALVAAILARVAALNLTIQEDKNLGSGFAIGHSYFCAPLAGDTPATWWATIVRHELAPLLREYWFDHEAKARQAIAALLDPL